MKIPNSVIITAMICVTCLMLGIGGIMGWIAVTHDGTNESLIVVSLIAVPTAAFNIIGLVIAHLIGGQSAIQAIQAVPGSVPAPAATAVTGGA